MHQRSLKPHVMLLRIVSSDTYEELWNGASEAGALVFTEGYLKAEPKVNHERLRVVVYQGNNIWKSNRVGNFRSKPCQPSLF